MTNSPYFFGIPEDVMGFKFLESGKKLVWGRLGYKIMSPNISQTAKQAYHGVGVCDGSKWVLNEVGQWEGASRMLYLIQTSCSMCD